MVLKELEKKYMKERVPDCRVGDTVSVYSRIEEGGKERLQVFQGVVIERKGGGMDERIWVRKISQGVGVEKMFLLHAPTTEKIKVLKRGKVRRAKLYYLRKRVGRKAKIKTAE